MSTLVLERDDGEYEDSITLKFELQKPISPEELQNLEKELPELNGDLLVISGRGPIWLYGFLLHHYVHLFKAVGFYDPKLDGAVIVARHDAKYEVGQVLRRL